LIDPVEESGLVVPKRIKKVFIDQWYFEVISYLHLYFAPKERGHFSLLG